MMRARHRHIIPGRETKRTPDEASLLQFLICHLAQGSRDLANVVRGTVVHDRVGPDQLHVLQWRRIGVLWSYPFVVRGSGGGGYRCVREHSRCVGPWYSHNTHSPTHSLTARASATLVALNTTLFRMVKLNAVTDGVKRPILGRPSRDQTFTYPHTGGRGSAVTHTGVGHGWTYKANPREGRGREAGRHTS